MKSVKLSATETVQLRVTKVLNEAIRVSPQWSGNYAVNWGIETNQNPVFGYQRTLKVEPWNQLKWWDTGVDKVTSTQKKFLSKHQGKYASYAGAPATIAEARKNDNRETIASIKWNTKIRLVNKAEVADLIESGLLTDKLRKVNMIPGNVGVVTYLKSKYPKLLY